MTIRITSIDCLVAYALMPPRTAAAHGQTSTMDNVLLTKEKTRIIKRFVFAALITALYFAIPHQRIEAQNPRAASWQPAKMVEIPSGVVIPDTKSILLRNDTKLAMRIHTRGLEPGHAYTVWWVIFNKPDECIGGCGPDDVGAGRGAPAVLYATGHVVGKNGIGNFAASRKVGDTRGSDNFGALQNPRGAEVHLAVRDHGPRDISRMPAQIKTFEGGVPGVKNVQFATHKPPQ